MQDSNSLILSDSTIALIADMVAERVSKLITASGQKEVMDTKECAEYLNITPGRLRAVVSMGNVPHSKGPNGRNYYRRSEIDLWRAGRRVPTKDEAVRDASMRAAKRKYNL